MFKKLLTTLLLSLTLVVPTMAQEKTDWGMGSAYVALASVTVADIDTTARAVERGLIEKNPIYKPFVSKPGLVGAVNGVISGGVALAAHHFLYKKGKKKEAKIVIWTWAAVRTAVVIHNIRELNKR